MQACLRTWRCYTFTEALTQLNMKLCTADKDGSLSAAISRYDPPTGVAV